MKKHIFENNQIYHIYNRGVDKRKIFLDDDDYFRFIHDLYEFNDEAQAGHIYYKLPHLQSYEVQPRKPRKLIVEILAFIQMPNHFHLLIKQSKNNGIVQFMQKFGTGYTMYFNKKYERSGSLFGGRFKAVPVDREAHLIHLPFYIHANALDLVESKWREGKIIDYKRAMKFLEDYKWSSFPDYIGKNNFPSVTQREFLAGLLGDSAHYHKSTMAWLKEMNFNKIKDVVLE